MQIEQEIADTGKPSEPSGKGGILAVGINEEPVENAAVRKVKLDYSTISDYSQRSWIRALFSKCGALTELWPSA